MDAIRALSQNASLVCVVLAARHHQGIESAGGAGFSRASGGEEHGDGRRTSALLGGLAWCVAVWCLRLEGIPTKDEEGNKVRMNIETCGPAFLYEGAPGTQECESTACSAMCEIVFHGEIADVGRWCARTRGEVVSDSLIAQAAWRRASRSQTVRHSALVSSCASDREASQTDVSLEARCAVCSGFCRAEACCLMRAIPSPHIAPASPGCFA